MSLELDAETIRGNLILGKWLIVSAMWEFSRTSAGPERSGVDEDAKPTAKSFDFFPVMSQARVKRWSLIANGLCKNGGCLRVANTKVIMRMIRHV